MNDDLHDLQEYLEKVETELQIRSEKLQKLQSEYASQSSQTIKSKKTLLCNSFEFKLRNNQKIQKQIFLDQLKARIQEAQNELDSASQRRLDVQLEINNIMEMKE